MPTITKQRTASDAAPGPLDTLGTEFGWYVRRMRTPRVRSMRQFAEAEYVLPDGPLAGRRFRCETQPFTRLWFDAIDSGLWNTFVATGPSQAAKSTIGFVIPAIYHLFELAENVILGVPDMNLAVDKWRKDIEPAIRSSRFESQLPTRGAGSRGGGFDSIRFRNGAALKFMSGGGSDKRRAAYTARVLIITETDQMDQSSDTSTEADKISQLMARTRSFGSRKRVYMECTPTIETGRTWREIEGGTASEIVVPCPHCRVWVTPARKHLVGWQDAGSALEARSMAEWSCPSCDKRLTEDQRHAANRRCKVLHRGQGIDKRGRIKGDPPATDTFGFRWSAFDNEFLSAGDIGSDLWAARRDPDEENAERFITQFVFGRPYRPPVVELSKLDPEKLVRRTGSLARGIVPKDCPYLTVAIDTGRRVCHYVVTAWREDAGSHIVDYGRFDVASDDLGIERSLWIALRDFRDIMEPGWATEDSGMMKPAAVFVDSNYAEHRSVVFQFCDESNGPLDRNRYWPTEGYGTGHDRMRHYQTPKKTGRTITYIGKAYHIMRVPDDVLGRVQVVAINADEWKAFVHERLMTPAGSAGAMTIYAAMPHEHISFSRHITAEERYEQFIAGTGPGTGMVTRWRRLRKSNHWLDCLYGSAAAGHLCGANLELGEQSATTDTAPVPASGVEKAPRFTTPDGRRFLITER